MEIRNSERLRVLGRIVTTILALANLCLAPALVPKLRV